MPKHGDETSMLKGLTLIFSVSTIDLREGGPRVGEWISNTQFVPCRPQELGDPKGQEAHSSSPLFILILRSQNR